MNMLTNNTKNKNNFLLQNRVRTTLKRILVSILILQKDLRQKYLKIFLLLNIRHLKVCSTPSN